jgi:phosphatidylethanolamine/phosphatidyl-N-methylethanolamine N-methyltransferase
MRTSFWPITDVTNNDFWLTKAIILASLLLTSQPGNVNLVTRKILRPTLLTGVTRMGSENWTFFRAFLKSPRIVASVIPSSTFLERRVVKAACPATARTVVELGAGTGGITRSLLRAIHGTARLLVIERTTEFVEKLEQIHDSRLDVVHGCASSIDVEMKRHGYPPADVVISGIPFSTLHEELALKIISAVHEALVPGGRFVAYQISRRVVDYVEPVMGPPEVEHELRNVPPLRVFVWQKESRPDERGEPSDAAAGG